MKRNTKVKKPLPIQRAKAPPKILGAPVSITRSLNGRANKKLKSPTAARNLEFGRRLRDIMAKLKIRQARVAEALEIGRDSMSAYANGKSIPHGVRLEKLCAVLNCKIGDLVPAYGTDLPGNDDAPKYLVHPEKDGTVWLTINRAVAKLGSYEEASAIILKLGLNKPS